MAEWGPWWIFFLIKAKSILTKQSKATIYEIWKLTKGTDKLKRVYAGKTTVRTVESRYFNLILLLCLTPQLIDMVLMKIWLSYSQQREVTSFWALLEAHPWSTVNAWTRPIAFCKSSNSKVLLLLDLTQRSAIWNKPYSPGCDWKQYQSTGIINITSV